MLERQREGIAKAKAEKKYKGRAPTARNQKADIIAMKAAGSSVIEISDKLSMSRMSVYRVLNDAKQTDAPASVWDVATPVVESSWWDRLDTSAATAQP